MKLYTDEWREVGQAIGDILHDCHKHTSMGSSRYEIADSGRFVTVKHRMRKDKEAVVTLGCWNWESPDGEHLTNEEARNRFSASGSNVLQSLKVHLKTTALLDLPQAQIIGQDLLAYLKTGAAPTQILAFPTYPGYEDMDLLT